MGVEQRHLGKGLQVGDQEEGRPLGRTARKPCFWGCYLLWEPQPLKDKGF